MELRTQRLLLRPWRRIDAARVQSLYSYPEVMRRLGDGTTAPMTQRAEAERAIERWLAAPAPTPLGDWAVEWLDPPPEVGAARVAGRVVLFPMPGEPATTEIAWHLHPDSWGHGLATEAARRVLDHGFSHGLGAATALTHLDHAASQRVCQRLGMTELGAEPTTYGVSMCRFVAEPGPGQRVAVPST